jgi:hypothetical protein
VATKTLARNSRARKNAAGNTNSDAATTIACSARNSSKGSSFANAMNSGKPGGCG